LMTPLLIFVGISPAVAVASVASHIAASSFSGVIAYWRRRAIDVALALMLLAGGILGTMSGGWLVSPLRAVRPPPLTTGPPLPPPARHRRPEDDRRERARHQPRASRQARRDPPARQPHVDPRPADQAALQAVEDLRLGHPAVGDRIRDRLHRRHHGHR